MSPRSLLCFHRTKSLWVFAASRHRHHRNLTLLGDAQHFGVWSSTIFGLTIITKLILYHATESRTGSRSCPYVPKAVIFTNVSLFHGSLHGVPIIPIVIFFCCIRLPWFQCRYSVPRSHSLRSTRLWNDGKFVRRYMMIRLPKNKLSAL
jgi:hypothetical protein